MDFKKGILSSAIAVVVYGSVYSAPLIAADVDSNGQTISADETITPANDDVACYPDGPDGCVDAALNANGVTGNIINSGTIDGGNDTNFIGLLVSNTTGDITNNGTINGFVGIDVTDGGFRGSIINESGATISGETGILLDTNGTTAIADPLADEDHGLFVTDGNNDKFIAISNAGTIRATGIDVEPASDKPADYESGSAIVVQDIVEGSIQNLSGGQIISENGHAILFRVVDTNPLLLTGDLNNAGLIEGKLSAIFIDRGRLGTDVDSYNSDGEIYNQSGGIIRSERIAIEVSGNGLNNINNKGIIEGYIGILVGGDSTDTIKDANESIWNAGVIRSVGADGLFAEALTHAIFADSGDDGGEVLGVTNTQSGTIDGRLSGDNLSLNNSGTLKTIPGSDFKSYVGNGTIVAVLDDKIVTIGESPDSGNDEFSSVLDVETATFNEGSKILIDSTDAFNVTAEGQNYVIVSATSLTDNGLEVASNSVLLDVAVYDDSNTNTVSVTVSTNDAGDVIASVGASEETQEMISSFQTEVLADLDENDPVYQMFEAASGDVEALIELAEALEPETSGADVAGATVTQSATFDSVSSRISSTRSGTNTGDMFQSGGVWAKYLHSKGKQDDKVAADGFKSRLNGITFGADGEINDDWTLGVAFTAADATTNSTGSNNSTDTSSIIGTVYGSWQKGALFFDAMASLGRSNNEGERLNNLIKSEYDADQLGFRLTAGQDIVLDNQDIVLQPTVSFNYGSVEVEAYEESGTAAALALEQQRYEVIELGAGLTAMKTVEFNQSSLDAALSLNVWHDFAGDQVQTQSRFLTGDTIITSTGAAPEKTTWQAGLGANYMISNNLTASVNYDHTWKSGFDADTISARLRYDF
ncbi:autotransporter outer membrane beta-barrel domain-containing protein [Endozoicomonas sp. ONNA2]|uniref:autotransporter family protein n=1 Tax=Endozoicomonas sp. ONNA2 TaxID=2828741 RepID=UPI0021492297|nr:autotransporter outer membrane beta-barrel domain-containing protein [Endozoicomonas sp. ONNA2]